MDKKTIKHAFYKSIPIMCSYVFMSIAYGMMMLYPDRNPADCRRTGGRRDV